MRFTVVSHACLYVEHGNDRLLIDPWLVGTAYWRSWANLPEPPPALVAKLYPTAIYLTHCHWDHCHGPSLQRFARDTPVYIADAPSRRLETDLRRMGHRDVRRIPHGTSVALGGGLRLWSWQFGIAPVDSVCGIRTEERTPPGILDVNDCKVYGAPLRRLLREFGRPEIVLRAHTSANAIPYCIVDGEGEEQDWPALRPADHYRREWWAFARHVDCDAAVPFASNHAFVHDETAQYNKLAMRAADVEADAGAARPHCWVMPPGSSWDERDGLQAKRFTPGDVQDAITTAQRRYGERGRREDASAEADPHALDGVTTMCHELTRRVPLAVRLVLPPTTIHTRGARQVRSWRIAWRRRRVTPGRETKPGAIDLEVHPRVLSEAARRRIGGHIGPSKRVRIRLDGKRPRLRLLQLRVLLACWEMADSELLPLFPNLGAWRLRRWGRRWREPLAGLQLITQSRGLDESFAKLWPPAK